MPIPCYCNPWSLQRLLHNKVKNKGSDDGLNISYLRKGLRLSRSEIHRLRCLNSKKQLAQKKLHLVLDIDQTLLHSIPLKEASELSLSKEDGMKEITDEFLVKLRPFVLEFLERASTMFEMYLYTFGNRTYSLKIAKILDPRGVYFGSRIISKDDNPAAYSAKLKTLDLVLGEESNVLIVDDNPNVWKNHRCNLILMKKYRFRGKITDETEMNTPLNQILKVLHKIHSAFFNEQTQRKLGGCKDVRKLAAMIRSTVLDGCNLYMKNVEDLELWKMAKELGARCSTELNPSMTHLISCKKGTKDYDSAVGHKKYSVGAAWIKEAYYLWQRQPEDTFLSG